MLNNSPFYRQSIRRYAVAFMSLFSDVVVQRMDANNTSTINTIKVPIAYGPRERFVELLKANPDLDRPVGISMPRMSCEMTGVAYDGARKFNSTKVLTAYASSNTDPSASAFTYVPVPVTIGWKLSVLTRTSDDANQIIEQILPFFTPEWTSRIRLIDELGIEFDVPVIFGSAAVSDDYDNGDTLVRRIQIWDMTFTMKAYLVGPPRIGQLIKIAQVNISDQQSNTVWYQSTITPGMTANGQPTSDPAMSVDPLTITLDDNWTYASVDAEYPNTTEPL